MVSMELLADKIDRCRGYGSISYTGKDYIKGNLNPAFLERPYQQEAIARFDFYLNEFRERPKDKPVHLLLNMATGSGKTVLMAANMLELYTKGYRNFIFIVNSSNIIKKTVANFTEKEGGKYLFAPKIIFGFTEIHINRVENFEAVPPDDINILFSTIQGLHTQLKEPAEGGLTFESLQQTKLVILSDEAHHLNALTKKKRSKTEAEEEHCWEWTINMILENHPENMLLEYTATVDFTHPDIAKKYAGKILVRYSLPAFRNDGYSKEIRLIKSGIRAEERILQALVLNQYRLKVADAHHYLRSPYLPLKPVILFKSAGIEESETCFENFRRLLIDLKPDQLEALESTGGATLKKAFDFFRRNGIVMEQLAAEIKDAFRAERCILVNSENDSDEKQLELNNLERNEYRAVFTVKMLTEGWDVLNLYDIVRLDESSGTNTDGKASAGTISEAQLIGRGARYFPFQCKAGDDMYRRKFDRDVQNDLRCLEELYYHSTSDNKYIEAITKELVRQGVYDLRPEREPAEIKGKASWKHTALPDEGVVKSSKNIGPPKPVPKAGFPYRHYVGGSGTDEFVVFGEEAVNADEALQKSFAGSVNKEIRLIDLGLNICLKAVESIPFYHFDNLKKIWPQLASVRELLSDEKWLAHAPVTLIGARQKLENLQPGEKVRIAENVLREIRNDLSSKTHRHEGKEFAYAQREALWSSGFGV